MPSETITCPDCGTPMNHHANKLVYLQADAADGEVMEQFYQCPHCGASLMRQGNLIM